MPSKDVIMKTSAVRNPGTVDWKKLVRELRSRLSGDGLKPLTQERFAKLMDVSWSTVARWESSGRVDPTIGKKLVRLRRALDALGELIIRKDRVLFFEQEHPLLLGMRAIDLLDNDRGCGKVIELCEGMESGSFA